MKKVVSYFPLRNLTFLLSFISLLFMGIVSCTKDGKYNEHNMSFYNVPISVAQQYSSGKWRLLYSRGGIAGMTLIGRNNEFLQLSAERIKRGNDSAGTTLDAPLTWTQGKWGSDTRNYYHYYFSPTLPYAEQVLEKIRNDTLIISDFTSDGFTYYYKKY